VFWGKPQTAIYSLNAHNNTLCSGLQFSALSTADTHNNRSSVRPTLCLGRETKSDGGMTSSGVSRGVD